MICKKNKDAWYYFFQFFKHVCFPLPVRFLLLQSLKIFTVGKILQLSADHQARWPLCKLWEHRFSVPDLVSSHPLPPPVVFFSIKIVFFEQSMQAVSLTSLPSLVFYSFTMFTNLKYNILMFFAPVSLFCCFSIEIWTVAGHVDRPNKFYNGHGSFVTSQNNGYCEEHATILNWQTTNRQLTDTLLTYQWHFVLKVRPYCLVC